MPTTIDFARQYILPLLPFPKTYQLGKYSNLGVACKGRETPFTVPGPGRRIRLWTTHSNRTRPKDFVHVDGTAGQA